jgi:hypothetical protein
MTVRELQQAIKACKGDAACVANVEALFVRKGGMVAVESGGKSFTDRFGGKVFMPVA